MIHMRSLRRLCMYWTKIFGLIFKNTYNVAKEKLQYLLNRNIPQLMTHVVARLFDVRIKFPKR